jgi:hypothetical protein
MNIAIFARGIFFECWWRGVFAGVFEKKGVQIVVFLW